MFSGDAQNAAGLVASTGLAASTRAIVEGGMVPVVVGRGNSKEVNFGEPTHAEIEATSAILAAADQLARLHAPKSPPPFELNAAVWAARVMQFACHRLVDKVEVDTSLPDELVRGEPAGRDPADHWSVDLVFRSWWDLVRRSFAANEQDTLNDTLLQVATRWPLAAVGTSAVCLSDRLDIVCSNRCLRLIYVDRVVARGDKAKAEDLKIANLISQFEV